MEEVYYWGQALRVRNMHHSQLAFSPHPSLSDTHLPFQDVSCPPLLQYHVCLPAMLPSMTVMDSPSETVSPDQLFSSESCHSHDALS